MKPIQHRRHVRRQALSSFSLQLFRDALAYIDMIHAAVDDLNAIP